MGRWMDFAAGFSLPAAILAWSDGDTGHAVVLTAGVVLLLAFGTAWSRM